jgi:hypothetical protein
MRQIAIFVDPEQMRQIAIFVEFEWNKHLARKCKPEKSSLVS